MVDSLTDPESDKLNSDQAIQNRVHCCLGPEKAEAVTTLAM